MSTPPRCPVPAEQQPINEYQEMCESWFYRWGSQDLRAFITPIVVLWIASWVFVGPVAASSFSPSRLPGQFGLSAAMGACILPILVLAQLYIGWLHVGNRLKNQAVPYEESGWYDGQVWIKPEEISNRDRLIVDYQVKPILQRVKAAVAILLGLMLLGGLTWPLV